MSNKQEHKKKRTGRVIIKKVTKEKNRKWQNLI